MWSETLKWYMLYTLCVCSTILGATPIGNGVHFTNNNQILKIALPTPVTEYTVTAWVNVFADIGTNTLISSAPPGECDGGFRSSLEQNFNGLDSEGDFELRNNNGLGSCGPPQTMYDAELLGGYWNFVAISYKLSKISHYFKGFSNSSAGVQNGVFAPNLTTVIQFGPGLTGYIDEIVIWDSALTVNELVGLEDLSFYGSHPGVNSHFTFDGANYIHRTVCRANYSALEGDLVATAESINGAALPCVDDSAFPFSPTAPANDPPLPPVSPTTVVPTTTAPTFIPTTIAPPMILPTTLLPTTLSPTTTLAPTTLSPTTIPPTTMSPTTLVPTLSPTTIPPTTLPPTTSSPSLAPAMPPMSTTPPTTLVPTVAATAPTVVPSIVSATTLPPTENIAGGASQPTSPDTLAPFSLDFPDVPTGEPFNRGSQTTIIPGGSPRPQSESVECEDGTSQIQGVCNISRSYPIFSGTVIIDKNYTIEYDRVVFSNLTMNFADGIVLEVTECPELLGTTTFNLNATELKVLLLTVPPTCIINLENVEVLNNTNKGCAVQENTALFAVFSKCPTEEDENNGTMTIILIAVACVVAALAAATVVVVLLVPSIQNAVLPFRSMPPERSNIIGRIVTAEDA